jgi:uncharacterized protein YkwD
MFRSLHPFWAAILLAGCVLASGRGADPQEPAKVKLSEDEQKILELTNQAREQEKLPPVKLNALLFEAARGHSANMARKGEMKHELDRKRVPDRVNATGYRWAEVGENIAETDGDPAAVIFKGWMDSKGHRANILNPVFTEIGIGIVRNDKGETYYTQVFAKPKKKAP